MGTAYPSSQIPEETSKLYVKMLADVPAGDLLNAAEAHIQDSGFFPKISELRVGYVSPALLPAGNPNIYPGCEELAGACLEDHSSENLINGNLTRYCKLCCGYYEMKEGDADAVPKV